MRGMDALRRGLGEGFHVDAETIGERGIHRNAATAATSLRRRAGGASDLVHAFGGAALTVAALGARVPIVFSPLTSTRTSTMNWLRAVMAYRRVEVISPTAT